MLLKNKINLFYSDVSTNNKDTNLDKMLCNLCNKNKAVIHFKGIFNQKTIELNLCLKCVKKRGIKHFKEISISDIISTLSDLYFYNSPSKEKKKLVCNVCGLTYLEFEQKGKFGCSNCYNTFSNYLTHIFERLHGRTKHIGKIPQEHFNVNNNIILSQKLLSLRKDLEQAIKFEQYEKAARIRDKINLVESKLTKRST